MFEDKEEHPSYGMASFSRVSGDARMFGSDFKHQHYMTLTISLGKRYRNLNNFWYCSGNELIKVRMSEAQWVELITRPNLGSGSPVTIEHVLGTSTPPLPQVETERQRVETEFKADCSEVGRNLNKLIDQIKTALENGKAGKTDLREILQAAEKAKASVADTLPFVEQQFAEAMENTITRAKVEVESYIVGALQRAGLEAIKSKSVNLVTE